MEEPNGATGQVGAVGQVGAAGMCSPGHKCDGSGRCGYPCYGEGEPSTLAPIGKPSCRICGAWDLAACWSPQSERWWIEPNLCSHCDTLGPWS